MGTGRLYDEAGRDSDRLILGSEKAEIPSPLFPATLKDGAPDGGAAMRNVWLTAIAGLVLIVYVATADYRLPAPMEPVYDPFKAVWAPDIFTDCETWEIRQSPAALEDVWSYADYMTVNGEGQYGPEDVVTLPRTDQGAEDFTFVFWDEGQSVYGVTVTFDPSC